MHAMIRSIKEQPLLCLGFTLNWIWVVITLQGPHRFPFSEFADVALPSWSLPLLVGAVTYLVLSRSRTSRESRSSWRRYCLRITLLMFAGLVLSTAWVAFDLHPITGVVVYVLGSILMGVGAAAIMVEFCRIYERLGPITVLFHGTVAMLAATVYQLALLASGMPQLNFIINPWFPLIIYVSLIKAPFPGSRKMAADPTGEPWRMPAKLIITTFIQGLAFGFGLGILPWWGDVFGMQHVAAMLSAGVAAGLLFVVALTFKADFTYLIYLVGFPLTAFGFLLMARSDDLMALGNAIQASGSCYQYIVITCLFVYLARLYQISSVRLVGPGMACLYLGQAIGGYVGSVAVLSASASGTGLASIASVMCFFLLISALYASNHGRGEHAWQSVRPGDLNDTVDRVSEGVRLLAVDVEFTPREIDILTRAARGRNKKHISGDLGVSEETVKTHLRSIYQKLGVHSHQELIDVVNRRAEDGSGVRVAPPEQG